MAGERKSVGLKESVGRTTGPLRRTKPITETTAQELPLVFFEIGHDRLRGPAAHVAMMDDEVVSVASG